MIQYKYTLTRSIVMFTGRLLLVLGFTFFSYAFASIGHITLLKGHADIRRNSLDIEASLDTKLENKDEIYTKDNTKVQISFENKTVVTLGSSTSFKVDEYLKDNLNPKEEFSVSSGAFKVITGNIGKLAPRNFLFKTKTVTIGIRGTTFVGEVDYKKMGKTYVACTKGSIELKSNNQETIVESGKMATVLSDGTIKDVTDISLHFFSLLGTNTKPTKKIIHKKNAKLKKIKPKIFTRTNLNTSKNAPSNVNGHISNSVNIKQSTNIADGEDSRAEMGSITIR